MTGARDATLQALRLKYNAALTAHQGCLRALTEAAMAGASASPSLVESEAKARRELDLARKRLLAAMTGAPEPPVSPAGSVGRPPEGTS